MNEPGAFEPIDRDPVAPMPAAPPPPPPSTAQTHPTGSPLPRGASHHPLIDGESDTPRIAPPPPGRALPGATDESSAVQRVMSAIRTVLPIVQRLMPLLDGNIASAVSNLIAPRPQAPAPPPKVDLTPLEDSLTELHTQHNSLREQVMEQNNTLKRVEDQLEMVREATDRNTLEQQELLEDMKSYSGKLKIVVGVGIGLLVIGILLNLILFLHIQRVLP